MDVNKVKNVNYKASGYVFTKWQHKCELKINGIKDLITMHYIHVIKETLRL